MRASDYLLHALNSFTVVVYFIAADWYTKINSLLILEFALNLFTIRKALSHYFYKMIIQGLAQTNPKYKVWNVKHQATKRPLDYIICVFLRSNALHNADCLKDFEQTRLFSFSYLCSSVYEYFCVLHT